jgi:hypothetical protein
VENTKAIARDHSTARQTQTPVRRAWRPVI